MTTISINAAIKAFDLETYLQDHAPDYTKAEERTLDCPTCGKRKLVVNLAKRAWHCWTCEASTGKGRGGLLDLIELLDGVTRSQAKSRVLHGYHGSLGITELGALVLEAQQEIHESPAIQPPPSWRWVASTGILPYCIERGISLQDARDFGLMWCDKGRYQNRLVFPVWEGRRLVYWQARAMWSEAQQPFGTRYKKTLNPVKVRGASGSGEVVFNLNRACEYPRVVICEGPIDAIHVGAHAVCTFGKRISPVQIGKLMRAGVRAIDLLWDGPSKTERFGAWPEMFSAAEVLREYFEIRLVFLPWGDPGDYSREHLAWYCENNTRSMNARPKLMEV